MNQSGHGVWSAVFPKQCIWKAKQTWTHHPPWPHNRISDTSVCELLRDAIPPLWETAGGKGSVGAQESRYCTASLAPKRGRNSSVIPCMEPKLQIGPIHQCLWRGSVGFILYQLSFGPCCFPGAQSSKIGEVSFIYLPSMHVYLFLCLTQNDITHI